jgi:2-polyprenyl-3-methyl-5-hydroxy-6-metoxy-1,4-benzoquinol methylase
MVNKIIGEPSAELDCGMVSGLSKPTKYAPTFYKPDPTIRKYQYTMKINQCRFCEKPLKYTFAHLGMSPLSNSYLTEEKLLHMEPFYPLNVYVCEQCFLVQLPEFESPAHIFKDYAYFSSFSETWLKHVRDYVEQMTTRFGFDSASQIIEIGSNDGYLLQYFVKNGISALGIEPAENVARVANEAGIPTLTKFFSQKTAKELLSQGKRADLIIANNVLAQVPTLTDFVAGMKTLLKPYGIITIEFPHLLHLINENQFDTIYHEHFSYFSFITTEKILAQYGLIIFDVDELTTHGGSLRIYATHAENTTESKTKSVDELRKKEHEAGLNQLKHYLVFNQKIEQTKRKLLEFLIGIKNRGKSISGYGAPAKGNTLLNYCGIRSDFIDYTVDRSPHKQGQFLPGSHIPIYHPDKIRETKPDYVLILPWNLKDEIMEQMKYIRGWEGKFIVPIPEVQVL